VSRRYLLLIPLLVIAIGLSLVSYFVVRHWEQNRTYSAFRGIASDRVHAIDQRVSDLVRQLLYLRASYHSSEEAGAEDVVGFSTEFRLLARDVIVGDGQVKTAAFVHAVSSSERGPMVETLRAAGAPYFDIFDVAPDGMTSIAPPRALYFPIVAAEPMPASASILGIDLWSDARVRGALERSMETGDVISVSPRFEGDDPSSPVTIELLVSLGESRSINAPDGFFLIDLRLGNVVEAALSGLRPAGIDLYLFGDDADGSQIRLYVHESRTRPSDRPAIETEESPFEWTTTVPIADRQLTIVSRPTDAFLADHTYAVSWVVLGSGLLTTAVLMLSLLFNIRRSDRIERTVAERTDQLTQEVTEHRAAEESLTHAQARVTEWANRLNQHNRRVELLGEMGDLLQSCQSLDEAYEVTARYAGRLFPAVSGVLYIYHESRSHLECVVSWGSNPIGVATIQPDECWALRRGKVHVGESKELVCRHVREACEGDVIHICIPLIAQGETIGIIELSKSGAAPPQELDGEAPEPAFDESTQQLASATAEHAALAFANIRLRETLRQQSIRDPLTGLYNRRYMEEVVDREIHRARRLGSELGVMIADIDFFKKFNDTYGHEAGDRVLQRVGEYLSGAVRREDIACRYGGEEFMLILPGASASVLLSKAEELRRGVSGMEIELDGTTLPPITLSVGIARLGEPISDRDTLYRGADEALYAAKKNGRDRVEVYEPTEAPAAE